MDSKKSRIFFIKTILERKTDKDHYISMEELKDTLVSAGYSFTYITVNKDIDTLRDNGMNIAETIDGHKKMFALVSREVDFESLKVLAGTIASNDAFPEAVKSEMLGSLCRLCSDEQAAQIMEFSGELSSENYGHMETMYLSVISAAIRLEKKITFYYLKRLPNGQFVFKKDPADPKSNKKYVLSPYSLHITDGHYYVRGYCDNDSGLRIFRLDRMKPVEFPKRPVPAVPNPECGNASEFDREAFYMFNGERTRVTLECDNDTADAVYDHFGTDITPVYPGNSIFQFSHYVRRGRNFYAWLCMFGGRIRIVGPQIVKDEFDQFLEDSRCITQKRGDTAQG